MHANFYHAACRITCRFERGYLFFRLGFTLLFRLIKKLPRKTAKILGFTLGALILLDTTIMGIHIAVFRRAPVYWTVRFR